MAFRPHWNDYEGAIKAGAGAVALVAIAGWSTWKLRYSPGVIFGLPVSAVPGIICAALCVMAAATASRLVASGVRRRLGLDVESGAVKRLEVAAARQGWSVDYGGRSIPGVGNIDALVRFEGGGAIVEIKSYGLRVSRGEVVRANGSRADKDVHQVLAQQAAVGTRFTPVLWCPTVKRASAAMAGSVLVVTGSAGGLVAALRRFA